MTTICQRAIHSIIPLMAVSCGWISPQLPDTPPMYVLVGPDRALLEGSWVFEGMEKQTQVTSIVCDKLTASCNETTAILDYNTGSGTLSMSRDNYQLLEWTKTSIVAVATDYDCVNYTLTINTVTKTAYKVRSRKSNSEECNYVAAELMIRLAERTER